MLDYGFITKAELKTQLTVADTVDDALLQQIINLTAGAIESVAGRPLRRDHARAEYFPGGRKTIRVDVSPIAKIHSIRESETRDFSDSDNYEELVEDTDYVLEAGASDGGRPGEGGVIRRLDGKWLGSEDSPGQVQVIYTGGYKADEEAVLENSTTTISAAADISDYTVRRVDAVSHFVENDSATEIEFHAAVPADAGRFGVVRFSTRGTSIVLPTWIPLQLALSVYIRLANSTLPSIQIGYICLLDTLDPSSSLPVDIYNAVLTESTFFPLAMSSAAMTASGGSLSSDTNRTRIQNALRLEHLSFAFHTLGTEFAYLASVDHATSALRPQLTIVHRRGISDSFNTPDDLRQANMLQAVHEFQTRKQPGMIAQAMRGVAIASGASYMKTQARLLPEVEAIAMAYRRLC